MARKRRSNSRRKSRGSTWRWLLRAAALAALFAIGFAGWFWWDMRDWRPSEELYPEQGAVVASETNDLSFDALQAIGAKFVYLELQPASRSLDDDFADRFVRANEADLDVGIVLRFDPCLGADAQSRRFTRMVPREAELLPPAVELVALAEECESPVSDAAVESELMTLINQIEMHAGKPAILKLGAEFEARHATARSLARDLWLMRDRSRPDYAPRPWLLWSANSHLISDASEEPIEWVVVQK